MEKPCSLTYPRDSLGESHCLIDAGHCQHTALPMDRECARQHGQVVGSGGCSLLFAPQLSWLTLHLLQTPEVHSSAIIASVWTETQFCFFFFFHYLYSKTLVSQGNTLSSVTVHKQSQ